MLFIQQGHHLSFKSSIGKGKNLKLRSPILKAIRFLNDPTHQNYRVGTKGHIALQIHIKDQLEAFCKAS